MSCTTGLQGLWIINAYPLVLVGLLLGTGTLGDKIGHRVMFLSGVTIFGLGSLPHSHRTPGCSSVPVPHSASARPPCCRPPSR